MNSGAILIRPATQEDAEAIASVHLTSWHEHYRGLLPDDVLESRTLDERTGVWRKALVLSDRRTFVACDDDEIVGIASAILFSPPREGFDSYLQSLYFLAAAKGRGTGRALLRSLASDLAARGCRNMVLRVLRVNPARGFYEHLGARLIAGRLDIDAGRFDDVAYAFDDIRVLL
jgi:L-amino acid N-acyltransferase YncA